jgi:hypothetical protein
VIDAIAVWWPVHRAPPSNPGPVLTGPLANDVLTEKDILDGISPRFQWHWDHNEQQNPAGGSTLGTEHPGGG